MNWWKILHEEFAPKVKTAVDNKMEEEDDEVVKEGSDEELEEIDKQIAELRVR